MAFFQAKMAMRPQKAKAATAPMPNMGAGAPWEAAGREGEHDPIERLKDMDTDGVDAEVLYMGSGGEAFYGVPREYLVDVFRAHNTAAIEFASVDPKRLIPVYTIPIIDVDLAVQEVERIALEGARAVQIPLSPWDMGLDPYWDEVYDPLWDVLRRRESRSASTWG